MATALHIALRPDDRGIFAVPNLSAESASVASRLLRTNHDEHDIIFTDMGLHNHIAHHLITAFSLGASSQCLEARYARNASYQRPPPPVDEQLVEGLSSPTMFLDNLGHIKKYPSYLVFFQRQIDSKGVPAVLSQYCFSGDEVADIMFARLFAGTLHPLIHLGFGLEFSQPAIIAEALAQTCIHPTWLDSFFFDTEATSRQLNVPIKPLMGILDEIKADPKLTTAAHWEDRNQMRDGVLVRGREEIIHYASQWRVDDQRLDGALAETVHAAVYFTATAQKPPKIPKLDFYFMHSVTSSIFFSSLLSQPWISRSKKAKLLEYKGRHDLLQYASRGAPLLLVDEVSGYEPKIKDKSDWNSIFERANDVDDDGHACKLVRALAHGEQICAPWEDRKDFIIKRGMWLTIGNMAIDSVEGYGEGQRWIRGAGFDEAWAR